MSVLNHPLVQKAREFATVAHATRCKTGSPQLRKYSGEPYVVHCIEVAELVATLISDPEVVAAALLHDTLEDTHTSKDDLVREFSPRVADLVDDLTDASKPSDGNRKVRKEIDRQHSAQAAPDAQSVKLCDLISNTRSIAEHDASFAVVYIQEKLLLLEVLTKGHPTFLAMARQAARDAAVKLDLKEAPWL